MISQLVYNERTDRIEFDGCDLHCGDCLTVLIVKDGKPKWVNTRIEYSESWYLVGLWGFQVNGLFAKMDET